MPTTQPNPARQLGRYEVIAQLASGGMGVVLLGRLAGAGGFQRLFAIKLLHAHYARDTEFVEMLLDEARIAAGIHHSNVVGIQEICQSDEHGYYTVMDYIEGFALSELLEFVESPKPAQWRMTNRIVIDALMGLDAAHSLLDAEGIPLQVVHRDVSPQNILVGVDGVARVTDFGVARAAARISHSQVGQVKGKLPYMAPEQARGEDVDARTDLFAMGVVLWESITGRRLFKRENVQKTVDAVLLNEIPSVSAVAQGVPPALEAVVSRALQRDPAARFQSAREMARALEVGSRAHRLLADAHEVGTWLRKSFAQQLTLRRSAIREATGSGAMRLELASGLPGGLVVPRMPEAAVRVVQPTQNLRSPTGRAVGASVPRPASDDTDVAAQRALGDEGSSLTPVRPMATVSALLRATGADSPPPASPPRPVAAPPRPKPKPRVLDKKLAADLEEDATKTPVNDKNVVAALMAVATAEPHSDLDEEPTKTPVNDMRIVTALLVATAQEPPPDELPIDESTVDMDPDVDSDLDTDDEPTEVTNWAPTAALAARREKLAAERQAARAEAAKLAEQQEAARVEAARAAKLAEEREAAKKLVVDAVKKATVDAVPPRVRTSPPRAEPVPTVPPVAVVQPPVVAEIPVQEPQPPVTAAAVAAADTSASLIWLVVAGMVAMVVILGTLVVMLR